MTIVGSIDPGLTNCAFVWYDTETRRPVGWNLVAWKRRGGKFDRNKALRRMKWYLRRKRADLVSRTSVWAIERQLPQRAADVFSVEIMLHSLLHPAKVVPVSKSSVMARFRKELGPIGKGHSANKRQAVSAAKDACPDLIKRGQKNDDVADAYWQARYMALYC